MLTAVVSALIGLANGLLPDLLKVFKDGTEAKREREFLDIRHRHEMERLEKEASLKMHEQNAQVVVAEMAAAVEGIKAAIAAQPVNSGFAWIDGLNAAIRPVFTMMIASLFALWVLAIIDPPTAVATLFSEAVMAVFGYVWGYRGYQAGRKLAGG